MNYLEQYYSNYDEEGRLLSRHGQVEYLTTMKYIHDALGNDKAKRILEVGAGTGRYSVTLAKEGYQVDSSTDREVTCQPPKNRCHRRPHHLYARIRR